MMRSASASIVHRAHSPESLPDRDTQSLLSNTFKYIIANRVNEHFNQYMPRNSDDDLNSMIEDDVERPLTCNMWLESDEHRLQEVIAASAILLHDLPSEDANIVATLEGSVYSGHTV